MFSSGLGSRNLLTRTLFCKTVRPNIRSFLSLTGVGASTSTSTSRNRFSFSYSYGEPAILTIIKKVGCSLQTQTKFHIRPSLASVSLSCSSFNTRQFSIQAGPLHSITASIMASKKKFERLPKSVIPSNYKLKLRPDLKNFTFCGDQDIELEVKSAVKQIKLNSSEVEVQEAVFKGNSGEKKAKVSYLEDEEIVCFDFDQQLEPGKGNLHMKFTGTLNDKMRGFYRSKYTVGEEERYAAVTQFEATDARRSFPCWDEPAIKATFDVTLVVPKDRVALSNMPVVNDKDVEGEDNLHEVTFDRTPIMSTYLLAFVVGEYDYVEGADKDGVKIRVYTPLGKKEQGTFALDVAIKTLPFYKDYFGIAYPLPKMDLIAIADFSAGAMENWGLVTYRETALLVDAENSSARIKQYVALVVGHEIAHQWFGNLVTMEWWTHLWLNEGFASWIEYLCVDHCFPEYDVWTQFVNTDLGRALEMDALENSHPIEVEVGHPSEVDEIFDAISYSKGCSVIRMLHNYIGDKDFRKGMHAYLTRHQYSNTFTEDLWAALEEASGKPVGKIMQTWTKQMGFPVLKVSQSQSGDSRTVTISQNKFMANGSQPAKDFSWMVPLTVCTQSDPKKETVLGLLEKTKQEFSVPNVAKGQWVKLNAGSVGMYRVMYPSDMLESLIPAVRDLSMLPKDRLGLQSDLFALSRAGLTPAVDVLKVANAFENERDYTVWANLSSNIASVSLLLQYTDAHDDFKKFVCKMFSKIAQQVGWDAMEGEDCLTPLLREVVLGRMGKCSDPATVAEANKRFEAHCSGTAKLSADLRSCVYCTALSNGGVEVFEKMLKLYDQADMQEEKVRISRTLGCVKDEALIKRVLDFSLSDKVRAQDAVFVIAGTTVTVKGREMAWQFFKDNFEALNSRYEGGFLLSRLVQSTTENFVTEEMANEVKAFFDANQVPAAERTIQQSIENIQLNQQWMTRESKAVSEFLRSFS